MTRINLYYLASTTDELAELKQKFEAKVSEALSWVDPDEMSEFQVVQAIHDYIDRNTVYNSSASSDTKANAASYLAYGMLVDGSCVCQGYALAYKLLLGRLGISCACVMSSAMNHMWNLVQMEDGNWYHVDATWDDPGGDATAEPSHTYFLRSDTTMVNKLSHHDWSAAYTTPASDYANRSYATYDGPYSSGSQTHTYANSTTVASSGVTFKVEWDDVAAGDETKFHVTVTGGSDAAKARMDVPTYYDADGTSESVCDPTRGDWGTYQTIGADGYDFSFEFTASGAFKFYFYFMDETNGITWLRKQVSVDIADSSYPSVSAIVSDAVSQARTATDGSEYQMALWLHDWELKQLDYDYSLVYCSAESGLTRGRGTCESFQRIYQKLLTCAGIQNARMEGNGHTWNAVRIDGKWCQVDVNWDDTDYSSSYGFDSTHLYFGLTDELMAVAHSDHASTYQADGYAYRSTDLSNNYFVRSGQAGSWADAYAERIQAKLDAGETSFSITSDNAGNPPSICGIQNAIVAYAINQRSWSVGGSAVEVACSSVVTTASSTSWKAAYEFTVTQSISSATIDVDDQVYTGSAIEPSVTVSVGNKALVNGADFSVGYSNNTNAGTATVTIVGMGSYAGTSTATFKILPVDASGASVEVADRTYTGKALAPSPTVVLGGKTLTKGTDYDVAYSNNVDAGTATVTVTFKGNYSGTVAGEFDIKAADASTANVKVSDQTWTGKALTPSPTVILGGKTLTEGVDYDLAYANNTDAGTATVTAAFKGNYSGVATGTFKITKNDGGSKDDSGSKGDDDSKGDSGSQQAGSVSMLRLYNPYTGEHFYTSNAAEVANLTAVGWKYEGEAWTAPSKSATPVYRLYNPYVEGGDHHYASNAAEVSMLKASGWSYEGVAWFSADAKAGVAVYRAYNPFAVAGTHHYTTVKAEIDSLVEAGWRNENIAWYGLK